MIQQIRRSRLAQTMAQLIEWGQDLLTPALLRRRTLGAALIASLLAAIYWVFIASERYVSEAHIIIQRTDLLGSPSTDFTALVGGLGGGGGSSADQLLLRDHLLSVDMLTRLDDKLKLRAHYSNMLRDPVSRMWSENIPMEWFHLHYLSRVSVEMDVTAGVLVIKAQAYDPKTAHAIASLLVQEGERTMNDLAHRMAEEQVSFLEKQVLEMSERVKQARQAVLDFQNSNQLASPQTTAENYAAIVNHLESKLTELQTRRNAMLGYLMPNSPDTVDLNMQIDAIEKQLVVEKARLVSTGGKALNTSVEEFQRLQLNAEFATDIYKTALVGLEKGRIEATRTLKKVSVLQSPTLPQYPLEPRRLYNTIVFILAALLIAGILHLIAAIIRDHKD